VRLSVGSMTKTLRVFGDRIWEDGLGGPGLSQPIPFVKMPLVYERAFGGMDLQSEDPREHTWERRNPVGTGFAVRSSHLVGQRGPNVEDPRNLITSWKQRPQPAGFGPLAREWMPRAAMAGTYDEKWRKERSPLLPEDFNERYYQCAPDDQQTPQLLRGGETVTLFNLAQMRVLRFNLPRVSLGFHTRFKNESIDHRGTLHTVILEPDVPRVLLVWHTYLPCHANVLKLRNTTIEEKTYLTNISPRREETDEDEDLDVGGS